MRKTDREVGRLMKEFPKHGKVGRAARAANMDRKTARKYLKEGKLPSELREERIWRTRKDPFEKDWEEIRGMLAELPELEAKALLDFLIDRDPERYQEVHLRTLQRRFKAWQATEGPPKRVFFPQAHRPGEAMQTDFTYGNELGVTIGGEPFPHLICHSVLPFSNWEWVSVCRSESMTAIRRGVQKALFELGHKPSIHQTDNSTAATHNLSTGKRAFNQEYVDFIQHFGMEPRTIAVGEKEQNGDIEAANGVFKRRVRQVLILRRSRDFANIPEYEKFLREIARKANRGRQKKLKEELRVMPEISVSRLPEYSEFSVSVTSWSTIRVKGNVYSVPSRLIREKVRVRLFEDRLEVFYGGKCQLTTERIHGSERHQVNYRHVISSLVKKPRAFERYRYREDLFPSLVFRKAYDALCDALSQRKADLEYLRCLELAARTMESQVEAALTLLLDAHCLPLADEVKDLVDPKKPQVPDLALPVIDLGTYDELLPQCREVVV